MAEFSVLMSVYFKENPEFLKQAIDSILNQTILPNEVVLVKDGGLTPELDAVIDDYAKMYKDLFVVVPLEHNVGLGLALAEGMLHCSNELVARMDTDDISISNRFELQLAEFQKHPELDICGGYIAEFEETPDKILARRTVPLDDAAIKKYQKSRDAFNHVSVMFKKEAVMRAGNYQSCLLMEDTLLWVNMIQSGAVCENIAVDLVYVRIGKDMYERRGGLKYYKKYKEGRKKVYQTGYIGFWNYFKTLIVQFFVCIMPNKLRGYVFKKILHK